MAQTKSNKFFKSARTIGLGAGLAVLAACTNMAQVGPAAAPLSAEEQLALQEARGVGVYLAARQAEANFDYVRASQLFQKVLAENPDNGEVLSRSFFAALYAGQWIKAQELAQKIVARAPSAGVSRLLLAVADMSQGNYDRIIAGVDKEDDGTAILLEPVVLAWAYAGKGDKENAIGALEALAQDGGGLHFHGLHTALIYDYLGEDDDAYKAYLNLLRLGGNGTRVAQAIGRFLERHEEEGSAARFYELYLEQVGRDTVIQREYDKFQEGGEKPRLIATPAQGLAEALYFAAYALSSEPRAYKVAQLYLQLSLFADPNAQQSLILMGQLLEEQQQHDRALYYYDKVGPLSVYGLMAAARSAIVRSDIDQVDEAIAQMNLMAATTQRMDERRNIYTIIGAIERDHQRWADAAATYTLAIDYLGGEPQAQDWDLFYARGIAHEQAGDWPKAEADMKFAMSLDPDQPHLLNYLGYSWIDRGENLVEGRKMIERAVELRPDDGYIVDSLGWAHYRLGHYKKAAKYLERAASLSPGEPVIIDHLGDALWKVGRRIEARFEWRRALKMKPDAELAEQIKRKLDMGLERALNSMPAPDAAVNGS